MKLFPLRACLLLVSCVLAVSSDDHCPPNRLTVYKVIVNTNWDKQKLPKHYPLWRPAAQWSKIVGFSHNSSYELFRMNHYASAAVRQFAEKGASEGLDENSQGEGGIFDEFISPPIPAGVGKSESHFFVDGNHSLVSLVSKIVPSPDWFIGLDSFNLCVNGNWLDSITVEVDPLDAGTDQGYTFTSPNWANVPPEKIYRITSGYPNHPAASFNYPNMDRLPPIANVQFVKLKQFELTEVYHHDVDSDGDNVVKFEEVSYFPNTVEVFAHEVFNYETKHEGTTDSTVDLEIVAYGEPGLDVTEPGTPRSQEPGNGSPTSSEASSFKSKNDITVEPFRVPKGDTNAILNRIVDSYYTSKQKKLSKLLKEERRREKKERRKNKKNKKSKKNRPPRNCRVSEWSSWGPCSKTCGIGESTRVRDVIKHARRGGKPCPLLEETKWCGSARNCVASPFSKLLLP